MSDPLQIQESRNHAEIIGMAHEQLDTRIAKRLISKGAASYKRKKKNAKKRNGSNNIKS